MPWQPFAAGCGYLEVAFGQVDGLVRLQLAALVLGPGDLDLHLVGGDPPNEALDLAVVQLDGLPRLHRGKHLGQRARHPRGGHHRACRVPRRRHARSKVPRQNQGVAAGQDDGGLPGGQPHDPGSGTEGRLHTRTGEAVGRGGAERAWGGREGLFWRPRWPQLVAKDAGEERCLALFSLCVKTTEAMAEDKAYSQGQPGRAMQAHCAATVGPSTRVQRSSPLVPPP
jgi:hypothetical protein